MGHKFADIAFTNNVKAIQSKLGSRSGYAAMEGPEDYNNRLGSSELEFVTQRDSFYMASVSETGWPYVQHRGGPQGFVKVLDDRTLGFADYSGNRQYVSVGNFKTDDRVSLFFMDYPNRRRLKIFGRVHIISPDEIDILSQLEDSHYRAQIERGIVITLEAFDWNCPQFITPRFSEADVNEAMQKLRDENLLLKEQASKPFAAEREKVEKLEAMILGDGPLGLQVCGVRQLTTNIRAYELRSTEGKKLPKFKPGAHLRIPVQLANGSMSNREYSISSDPARRDFYEIAVRYDEMGRGGSKAVHRLFKLGTQLRVEPPINHFPLHSNIRPALLIAGGIGITPLKSMAHALATRKAGFQLYYATKCSSDMAYREELLHISPDNVHLFISEENNRLDVSDILGNITDATVVYVCGPDRLINEVLNYAREKEIPRDQIVIELFS